MYNLYENKNNIWKTEHFSFPVAKSTPMEPDGERAKMIDNALKNEETKRKEEDVRLNSRIDREITDRESADNVLQNNIEKEKTDRIASDNTLDSKINKEIQDRKDSEEILEGLINDEKTARETKDTELENRISALESGSDGTITQNQFNIMLAASPYTNKITEIETKNEQQDGKITTLETSQTEQDAKINALEASKNSLENRVEVLEQAKTDNDSINNRQNVRLDALETKDATIEGRLDALEQGGSGGSDETITQEKFNELLITSPYTEKTNTMQNQITINTNAIAELKEREPLTQETFNSFLGTSQTYIADLNNTERGLRKLSGDLSTIKEKPILKNNFATKSLIMTYDAINETYPNKILKFTLLLCPYFLALESKQFISGGDIQLQANVANRWKISKLDFAELKANIATFGGVLNYTTKYLGYYDVATNKIGDCYFVIDPTDVYLEIYARDNGMLSNFKILDNNIIIRI